MVTERPVVELGEFMDATPDTRSDGGGPENTMLAESQVVIVPLRQEPFNFFIRSARKEKDLVKIALTGKFGLFLRQAGVLHEFAGRERVQGYNGHAGILRECLERISSCGQSFSDGNTSKAAEAQGRRLLGSRGIGCGPEMEVVFRQVNGAAIFRNERMSVAVFAAGIVELKPRAAGQPDGGNGFVVEGRGEFIEAAEAGSPEGDERIN